MGGFLLVHDPDEDRRARFLARAAASLAPPHLEHDVDGLCVGAGELRWVRTPGTPVDVHRDPRGAAWCLGRALAAGEASSTPARAFLDDWVRLDGGRALGHALHCC